MDGKLFCFISVIVLTEFINRLYVIMLLFVVFLIFLSKFSIS